MPVLSEQNEPIFYSVEDNAVFDLISPSGMVLTQEAISESSQLRQTSDYPLIVGDTRGNATDGWMW